MHVSNYNILVLFTCFKNNYVIYTTLKFLSPWLIYFQSAYDDTMSFLRKYAKNMKDPSASSSIPLQSFVPTSDVSVVYNHEEFQQDADMTYATVGIRGVPNWRHRSLHSIQSRDVIYVSEWFKAFYFWLLYKGNVQLLFHTE